MKKIITEIIDTQQELISSLEQGQMLFGVLYTQLPEQTPPQELWPHMNWLDITSEYSGLFFSAEGSSAQFFDQIEQANQSWISSIYKSSTGWSGTYSHVRTYFQLQPDQWSQELVPSPLFELKLFTTGGEN